MFSKSDGVLFGATYTPVWRRACYNVFYYAKPRTTKALGQWRVEVVQPVHTRTAAGVPLDTVRRCGYADLLAAGEELSELVSGFGFVYGYAAECVNWRAATAVCELRNWPHD